MGEHQETTLCSNREKCKLTMQFVNNLLNGFFFIKLVKLCNLLLHCQDSQRLYIFGFIFGLCCDVHGGFCMKTMFGSSFPPVVCRRSHLCLLVYSDVKHDLAFMSNTAVVL
jgi:hypothetical protein